MAKETITKVDAFLGLNESADGFRELALGEASKAVNWQLTDGRNIKLRPGIRNEYSSPGIPAALWTGYIRDRYYMIAAIQHPEEGSTDISIRAWDGRSFSEVTSFPISHSYGKTVVKVFTLFSTVFIAVGSDIWSVALDWDNSPYLTAEAPYIPLVITGSAPAGGGDVLENLNILSDFARVQFSADGTAKDYFLPTNAGKVTQVEVDNVTQRNAGTFDAATQKFTFTSAPVKGVNNVQITYEVKGAELLEARAKFAKMPYAVSYNGSTDSRLFFYGDGSNITYYTGVTEYGRASALYLPAGNEIAVDMSDSPITAATRHHSKLMFFKPDCTAAVTYEPISLADGRTIAGFTMKTIQSAIGNVPYGQVEIISNNPRTIANGNLYEWVLPNIYSTDERNAKVVSDKVCKSLAAADASRIVTLNDSDEKTYYIFLNDSEGTVLVNRYNIDSWVMYQSHLFRNVRYAQMYGAWPVFLAEQDGNTVLCYMDPSYRYDDHEPINAEWHTGYMDFKADYLRKYSSNIWVSVLPEALSKCDITASTDRRESYNVKSIGTSLFNYSAISYNHWTYAGKHTPTIKKVRLKVKKFVYYKLIFSINEPGCTATILGYDQQVRFGSEVK